MLNLKQTLNSELPQSRFLVLELAALLDRVDEAAGRDQGGTAADAPLRILHRALDILGLRGAKGNRVEQILRLYSDADSPPTDLSR